MGRATKPQTFCLYTFLIAIMLSSFTYGKGIYVDVNVAGEDVVPHIQWSQPPVEIDPNVDVPPVFFGWSEPARSTEYTGSKRQQRMDADDFCCLGPMPITGFRWWGSYKGWGHPEPPALQPVLWHIGIWANQVDDLEPNQLYIERLVWSVEVPYERVHREPVGLWKFPEKSSEMCYEYELALEPEAWFRSAEFASNYYIFWINITAVYTIDTEPLNLWGWVTRSSLWGNSAVTPAILGDWPTFDEHLSPGRIYPVENAITVRAEPVL